MNEGPVMPFAAAWLLNRSAYGILLGCLFFLCGFTPAVAATSPSGAESLALWPGTAPGSENVTAEQEVIERSKDPAVKDRAVIGIVRTTLELWRPERPNGTAVIVLPGGAYQRVVMDKEGIEMGQRLNRDGLTVLVLAYRLPGGGHARAADVPLQDAQRTIRLVRKNAQAWNLDVERIGVMGFSAGGHVAASLGTKHDQKVHDLVDDSDALSARPDFLALVYPVTSMETGVTHDVSRKELIGAAPPPAAIEVHSLDRQAQPDMPPTFLLHADDDPAVDPENSIRFYRMLRASKVPAELHIFHKGGHGFGLRFTQDLPVAG
jgi:acetyl esterase/lipase